MPPDQLVSARAYSRTAAIFCLCELDCLGKSFFCGLMADDVETGIVQIIVYGDCLTAVQNTAGLLLLICDFTLLG